jgi:branched-chain amino acid transport system permease protein
MVLAKIVIAQPLVFGLANGAAFGLVAIGLVLIYKSSRVFNFAAGEFVTLGAFSVYVAQFHMAYPLAMLVGVVVGTAAGLLTERLVVRPLADRPKVTILVATAALAIVLIPIELMKGGAKTFNARAAVPGQHVGLKVLGVYVSPQQGLIFASLVIAAVLLAIFFSRTDLGLATLATSQEPTASRLVGIRLNRISAMVWGATGFLGGLAGVLLPPVTTTFNAGFGTANVLIPAFTAAVLGGMTSIPGAFVGGLLVGVIQSMAQFNINSVPGANSVAILVVLIAVLVIRPAGLLGKEA